MSALLRGLVWRWIARHRLRSALAVLAVALGVAAFLASVAVARSIVATGTTAAASVGGGADLVVSAEETGLPTAIVSAVRETPGVDAASGVLAQWIRSPDVANGRVLVLGADLAAEKKMRRRGPDGSPAPPLTVTMTGVLAGTPVAVSRPVADELAAAGAKLLRLHGAQGERRFSPAAIVDLPRAAHSVGGGRFVAMPLALAGPLLGRGDRVDRIDVTLAPGADAAAVAAAIHGRIAGSAPSSVTIGPPGMVDATTQDLLGAADVGLKLGAVVALLVGVFLIHHTVSIGVTERRREAGILRALGATRRQVMVVFCAEAAALGLVGSAIGVALGYALATTSLEGFAATISSTYFPSEPVPVELPWTLALAGVAAGVLTALVAAYGPARKAARQPPDEAIRRGPEESARGGGPPRARIAASLVLLAIAVAGILMPTEKYAGYVAAIALLFSFVVAAPVLLGAVARALAPLLARLGGVPGRLAADELSRHASRAAMPAAALAFGFALVVENLGVMTSLSQGTTEWMEQNVAGDLFVSSGDVVMKAGGHTLLDADLRHDIERVPGVAFVTGVRMLRVPWRDTRILVLGLDAEAYRGMARLSVNGADDAAARDVVLARLATGADCLVSENFAALHDTSVGGVVDLPASDGTVSVRVVGLFPDYTWPRGTVLVDRSVIETRMRDRSVDEFSVRLAPGAREDDVRRGIEAAVGEGRALVVTSAREMQAAARALLADFFSLAYAQVAVALAVAFLGVLNSLWIAVMMRRRELGLFRAAGATRGQLVRSVVLQAGTLGFAGGAFGVVGGIAVEWIALRRVVFSDTGWVTRFDVPWAACGIVLAAGVAVSILAGWIPARNAARTEIRDAVGWE